MSERDDVCNDIAFFLLTETLGGKMVTFATYRQDGLVELEMEDGSRWNLHVTRAS